MLLPLSRPSPQGLGIGLSVFGVVQLAWTGKVGTLGLSPVSNRTRYKIILNHAFFSARRRQVKRSLFFLHNVLMAHWWLRWQAGSFKALRCFWSSHGERPRWARHHWSSPLASGALAVGKCVFRNSGLILGAQALFLRNGILTVTGRLFLPAWFALVYVFILTFRFCSWISKPVSQSVSIITSIVTSYL